MVKRELKQVKNSLADFEKRHEMNSDEFYEKFNAGKLGDDREYMVRLQRYIQQAHGKTKGD